MKHLKKIIPFLALMPFVIGTIGYGIAGEKITDALYASFALYFVNPVSDSYNAFIDISRWSAALVTTSAVIYALRRLWTAAALFVSGLVKDSIAVYSDSDVKIKFERPRKGILYLGNKFNAVPKSQIIIFDSDEHSLQFYEEHKAQLRNRKVYISLKTINPEALKDNPNINFFHVGDAVARTLWKRIALWKQNSEKIEITILGTEHLGQCILNCGLLINLFSPNQEITYNFIGSSSLYRISHGEINTFNRDSVRYFNADDKSVTDIIRQSDITIVSEKTDVETLQAISVICGGKILYYSPDGCIDRYLAFPNVEVFGNDLDTYTDENIRQNKLINSAIDQNHNYLTSRFARADLLDKYSEWNKLNGFLKWSNISSSDYKDVLIYLGKNGADVEDLSELEHIRWCRFHILNHWKYGVPENGKAKDPQRKIHQCLCSYQELSEAYKDNDRMVVKEALKLAHCSDS